MKGLGRTFIKDRFLICYKKADYSWISVHKADPASKPKSHPGKSEAFPDKSL